jgi:two-component system chemotaxis response regulator CheY
MILTRKLKILITDDSLLLRRKLKQELESLDCEVFEAKNGKEAVMMYLTNQPDGTFLDIVMPEVGGLEALQAIRKINEKAQVIMLSSTGTSSKLVETLKFGAIDFIQKPYTTQQIKKTLDDIRKKVEADA